MMRHWRQADQRTHNLEPVRVRGLPGLAWSDHPAFPETVPHAGTGLPRFTPASDSMTLADLVRSAADLIADEMDRHPAILFTGLEIGSRKEFGRFVEAMGLRPHAYRGGNAIRDKTANNVNLTSYEPPEIAVTPHNELSYMPGPPSKILFYCQNPADVGGEVPINDVRKIPPNLADSVMQEVRNRGIRYYRRYPAENTSQVTGWRQSFEANTAGEVEDYLAANGVEYCWQDEDVLQTWYSAPAFQTYQGEEIWFNQMTEMNSSYWLGVPYYLAKGLKVEEVQSDTSYGDGEPFPEDLIRAVRGAIWQSVEVVKMAPGDILFLDNFLVQHGRMPYGGTRQHFIYLAV